jgi:hypothetical protein
LRHWLLAVAVAVLMLFTAPALAVAVVDYGTKIITQLRLWLQLR